MNTRKVILSAALALVLAVPRLAAQNVPPVPPVPAMTPATGVLTVRGQGQVSAVPDMVTITVGVESEAATADAALDENTAAMGRVFALLKAEGVAPGDIRTSQFSVNPVWDNSRASVGRPPVIRGFAVSNLVTVSVRELPRLGPVLDALIRSGANRVQGVRFGLNDPGPQRDRARVLAVAEARRKAQLYAEAAGVSLGALLALDETASTRAPGPFALEARAMADSVPVTEGELTVSAEVTLRYAIGQ